MANLSARFESTPALLPLGMAVDTAALEREVAVLVAAYGKGAEKYQFGKKDSVPWYVLMLQSCGGTMEDTLQDNGQTGCAHLPTKVLNDPRAAYMSSLLLPLGPLLFRARLSILPPDSFGWYHNDPGKWQKVARVHIPVTRPSSGYSFLLGGRLVELPVGSVVMGDFNIPHTLWNLGNVTRATLLLDIDISRPELLGGALGEALLRQRERYAMTAEREQWHSMSAELLRDFRKGRLSERKAMERRRATQLLETVSA